MAGQGQAGLPLWGCDRAPRPSARAVLAGTRGSYRGQGGRVCTPGLHPKGPSSQGGAPHTFLPGVSGKAAWTQTASKDPKPDLGTLQGRQVNEDCFPVSRLAQGWDRIRSHQAQNNWKPTISRSSQKEGKRDFLARPGCNLRGHLTLERDRQGCG